MKTFCKRPKFQFLGKFLVLILVISTKTKKIKIKQRRNRTEILKFTKS